MEQTLEENVRQYTESLQSRIREVLTGVDSSKLDKVILDKLGQQELLDYTDKVMTKALEGCFKSISQEVEKLLKKELKDLISEKLIRKTLREADVAETMTRALCKRVASAIEDPYY